MIASPNVKERGAYYTDSVVAQFLVRWAIRSARDVVMDPSFGGGVFLQAAAQLLGEIGGDVHEQILGVELDEAALGEARELLCPPLSPANLELSDFFQVEPKQVDAVVGNPPFLRYQSFSGDSRQRALGRSAAQGVTLSRLASSWAPFIVHGAAMLKEGGRLAMVLPMEMWHASYARPVAEFLHERFASLQVVTFKQRLFQDISQDTILLLADGYRTGPARLRWRDLENAESLLEIEIRDSVISPSRKLDTNQLLAPGRRLIEQFIPGPTRTLYRRLAEHPAVRRLGSVADVGIGYVSGNNDYFHLSRAKANQLDIPPAFLARAVRRGRAFNGPRFTARDWNAAELRGDAAFLLTVPDTPPSALPKGVQAYLRDGEADGVHLAYKCRVRSLWYRVPHVYQPDAFLTYMSGRYPRFVVNQAGAVAPNNLHVVRMRTDRRLTASMVACVWGSALTRLSVELEGHAMGGGMLKLEPKEAESILLPPLPGPARLSLDELDRLARSGNWTELEAMVDKAVMCDGLGLTMKECKALRAAAELLIDRRHAGKRPRSTGS